MKVNAAIVVLFFFLAISCNKDDCETEKRTLATGELRLDSNGNSPHFKETVLKFYYSWKANVDCTRKSVCLYMEHMNVKNLTTQDIDLTLSLVERGDFTFSIAKGDSIDIQPLPDFCKNNTLGTVKEIKYK